MSGNLPILRDAVKSFEQFQTKWAALLNPVLGNPLVNGIIISNIHLLVGDNTINHRLQRNLQGYVIVDQDAAATFYRKTSQLPDLTMVINSSAIVNVSLYVF